MPANDRQVGGGHYKKGGEEHWDRAWRLKYDPFQYIITKWLERWREKGGITDLEKAAHALEKYIEVVRNEPEFAEGPQAPVVVRTMVPTSLRKWANYDHHSTPKFCLEGVQGDRAEYTCRKCGHSFWANAGQPPQEAHPCPLRDTGILDGAQLNDSSATRGYVDQG